MKKIVLLYAIIFLAVGTRVNAQLALFQTPMPVQENDTLILEISPESPDARVAGVQFHYNIQAGAFDILSVDSDIESINDPVVLENSINIAEDSESPSLNIVWFASEDQIDGIEVPVDQTLFRVRLLVRTTNDDINNLIDREDRGMMIDTSGLVVIPARFEYDLREGPGASSSIDVIYENEFLFTTEVTSSLNYQITDVAGRVIARYAARINPGQNRVAFPEELQHLLQSGVYVLTATDGVGVYAKQFFAF